jgi:hypothetical protein
VTTDANVLEASGFHCLPIVFRKAGMKISSQGSRVAPHQLAKLKSRDKRGFP